MAKPFSFLQRLSLNQPKIAAAVGRTRAIVNKHIQALISVIVVIVANKYAFHPYLHQLRLHLRT